MDGVQLSQECLLKVQKYLKADQRAGGAQKGGNNLFVKQFPRQDFSDEDLKVNSLPITF